MFFVFELFANKNPCSLRQSAGNVYNEAMLNYVPALTKQYDYGLTNIYLDAAQPNLNFKPIRIKAGEIGGQIGLFYQFKKETPPGGKYGTNILLTMPNSMHLKVGKMLHKESVQRIRRCSGNNITGMAVRRFGKYGTKNMSQSLLLSTGTAIPDM